MKRLKKFEQFNYLITEKSNIIELYKDENLEVLVSKTFDATKELNKDTYWCSSSESGFYMHNRTANMYRINFKDGYKLRLTWDYIHQKASEIGEFSGGTHWGQGGIVDGETKFYDVLRPVNNDDPFFIDWKSSKEREIVDRIKSLPKEAIDRIKEYQNKSSLHKSRILTGLYKEIEKVKILDAEIVDSTKSSIIITIAYNSTQYKLKLNVRKSDGKVYKYITDYSYNSEDQKFAKDFKKFKKDFRNKYLTHGPEFTAYLYDKAMGFIKRKRN